HYQPPLTEIAPRQRRHRVVKRERLRAARHRVLEVKHHAVGLGRRRRRHPPRIRRGHEQDAPAQAFDVHAPPDRQYPSAAPSPRGSAPPISAPSRTTTPWACPIF